MSPRGLPAGVASDFQSATPTPLILVDLVTGGSPSNLRWTRRGEASTFAGSTFSPRRFELDEAKVAPSSQTPTLALRVDDTDGAIQALWNAGADFIGRRCTVFRTNVGSTGGAGTDALRDVYYVESWDRVSNSWAFALKPLTSAFDEDAPRAVFTKSDFPGIPAEAG